jgi:AraC-like DNA-binding protein
VALLRHTLHEKLAEPLEAEVLALTLVRRTMLVLSSDLMRRWTLAEIAGELRVSPVYVTQVFQQEEGLPLYQYQLRLRLACALDLLARYDDLTTLALDLGFSSHSHFTVTFRRVYGCSPSAFKRSALHR